MKKIAVTGGGGFIGAYLVRSLIAHGYSVVVVDNMTRGVPARLDAVAKDIELYDCDVRDAEALGSVFRGVNSVFHLAAVNGTDNFYNEPQLVLDVGVRGALAVIEACHSAGVAQVIMASSAEVYQTPAVVPTPETAELLIPDSLNPRYSYGGSKLISELIAFNYFQDSFDNVQIFRPHNVYGPDMGYKHVIPQFIQKAKSILCGDETDFPIIGSGMETRAFCYVDDVVAGLMLMLERGRHRSIYHIGNDDEVSVISLAKRIMKAMNVVAEISVSLGHEGGTLRRCPDISKMRELGYQPRVNLDEGLSATVDWYLNNEVRDMENKLL